MIVLFFYFSGDSFPVRSLSMMQKHNLIILVKFQCHLTVDFNLEYNKFENILYFHFQDYIPLILFQAKTCEGYFMISGSIEHRFLFLSMNKKVTYIYKYIYACVYVCVCVCVMSTVETRWMKRRKKMPGKIGQLSGISSIISQIKYYFISWTYHQINNRLNNRDIDHPASTIRLTFRPSPDTWPRSYIYDLPRASRFTVAKNYYTAEFTLSIPTLTVFGNMDFQHRRDYTST